MCCHSQSPVVSEVLKVLLLKSFYHSLPLFVNFFPFWGESCVRLFLKGLLINFKFLSPSGEGRGGGNVAVTLKVV